MGGAVGASPTSSGQQGQLGGFGLGPAQGVMPMGGGLPMTAPAQQAPVGAPPVNLNTPSTPTPTGELQFGTAGTGTAGEPVVPPAPQAAPQQAMQQQMYRPQMQQQMPQYQGLQQLLSRMLSGYQQPQQRIAQPMQYQNRALAYRPNMAAAQQNLGRTATSQAEAQAAAAKKALEDQQAAADDEGFLRWQRQQYEASKNANYGGG